MPRFRQYVSSDSPPGATNQRLASSGSRSLHAACKHSLASSVLTGAVLHARSAVR